MRDIDRSDDVLERLRDEFGSEDANETDARNIDIFSIAAALAEARKDQRRYRWARENLPPHYLCAPAWANRIRLDSTDPDEVIDAAVSAESFGAAPHRGSDTPTPPPSAAKMSSRDAIASVVCGLCRATSLCDECRSLGHLTLPTPMPTTITPAAPAPVETSSSELLERMERLRRLDRVLAFNCGAAFVAENPTASPREIDQEAKAYATSSVVTSSAAPAPAAWDRRALEVALMSAVAAAQFGGKPFGVSDICDIVGRTLFTDPPASAREDGFIGEPITAADWRAKAQELAEANARLREQLDAVDDRARRELASAQLAVANMSQVAKPRGAE